MSVVDPGRAPAPVADGGARPGRQPVLADVARLAGVSNQTVSRVVNNEQYVAVETRDRVLAAIRMLGYRPNAAARALVTGRSRTVGVVTFDTRLFGPASTLAAIERAADDAGYFVTIASLRSLDRPSLESAVGRLQQQGVDGILVIAPLTTAVNTLPYLARHVPLVAVETGPEQGIPVVAIDQRAGATLATRHLLDLGHRTVHHIAGPAPFQEAQQRLEGWRATLRAAGAAAPPPIDGDWTAEAGYRAGRQLLNLPAVTAVFTANDQMALGLYRAVQESGRRVPQDISIVGFDDIPEAAYFHPPLSTVRQSFSQLGQRSLRLLLDHLRQPAQPQHEIVAPELLLRASTAPPPEQRRHR